MEIGEKAGKARDTLRKAVVPGAASVVGAGAGLLLTKQNRKLRAALPDLNSLGVADLVDDLRGKLDTVLGTETSSGGSQSHSGNDRPTIDANELATRRQQRDERRSRRRERARN